MSVLGFANYYREFKKRIRKQGVPNAETDVQQRKEVRVERKSSSSHRKYKAGTLRDASASMHTEKSMYVLDSDASEVAISGILHQEQESNGRKVLRPIAYGS